MPAAATSADHTRQRDLAVAWMNRGHALHLQGRRADLAAALDAYAEAIALLRPLPLAENPAWANSLAAALMNRGALLHRAHGRARADEALGCFAEAEATLQPLLSPSSSSLSFSLPSPWPRRNLAGTLLNRASQLLDLGRHAEARADAARALALSAPHERDDLADADLSLKSRRALCDALGFLIVAPGAEQDALAREASDLVDDGLDLARFWTTRGTPQPRELALRLFRFGAALYRLHQPHFLAEFLAEQLEADPADTEARAIALEAVDAALAARPVQPFLTVGDPASERHLRTARELEALRPRLVARAANR